MKWHQAGAAVSRLFGFPWFDAGPRLAGDYRLLLFFGSPRTGSTLLGQILNAHPQALVANEYRFLQRVVREKRSVTRELAGLRRTAYRHFRYGIENDGHFRPTLRHYQPKWSSFSDLHREPLFGKRTIAVLGDKKAGGNVGIYLEHEAETLSFIEAHRPLLLQIVRHPLDAAHSAAKAFATDIATAVEDQVKRTKAAADLLARFPADAVTVRYEDLLEQPVPVLTGLLSRLQLEIQHDWLDRIAERLAPPLPRQHSSEELAMVASLVEKYDAMQVYASYFGCAAEQR